MYEHDGTLISPPQEKRPNLGSIYGTFLESALRSDELGEVSSRSHPRREKRAPGFLMSALLVRVLLLAAFLQLAAPLSSPPPLLCVTTASSLEGVAFCRNALHTPGEFRVRALVRNLHSARARTLAELGAEVMVADNEDEESLRSAFDGVDGLYAITTWSGSRFTEGGQVVRADNLDPQHLEESEVKQGLNILRAAERTPTLQHFVLQSMHTGGRTAADASIIAPLHHRAKWRQEQALRASSLGCAWSILRQPTYMENFGNDATAAQGTQLRRLRPGVVSGLLAPEEEITVISVNDLGAIATAMLREGPEANDRRVLAAGAQRVSGASLAAAATRVHGECTFAYQQVPKWVLQYLIPSDYPQQLQKWLSLGGNDEGADPAAAATAKAECLALHPEMQTLDEWLREQNIAALPTPPLQRFQRKLHAIAQRAAGTPAEPLVGNRRAVATYGLAAVAAAVGRQIVDAGQTASTGGATFLVADRKSGEPAEPAERG